MNANEDQTQHINEVCMDIQQVFYKAAERHGCGCNKCMKHVTELMVTGLAYSIAHIAVEYVEPKTHDSLVAEVAKNLSHMIREVEMSKAVHESQKETIQ